MDLRRWKPTVLSPVLFFLVTGPLFALDFNCPHSDLPWKDEGAFVELPAGIAAAPGQLVGGALALAFVPADLVEAKLGRVQDDAPIPRFALAGLCAGAYFSKGTAFVVGAPFWLLKQMFWTGPKRLFTRGAPVEPMPSKDQK